MNPFTLNLWFLMENMEFILVNLPSDKHKVCTINNGIAVNIPSFPYLLLKWSVLCNCGIEAENNFLLGSILCVMIPNITWLCISL